jgi:hypothetical protein
MILRNTDIQTLMDTVKFRPMRLVCFGAGDQLRQCCDFFRELDFFSNICYILDNAASEFVWEGNTLVAISLNTFLSQTDDCGDIVFFITALAYPEIYEQLDRIEKLRAVDCYIYTFVRHMPIPYAFPVPPAHAKPKIPKKIHYVWFGGQEILKQNKIWMETWDKYCPDYEIIRWDESNYDVSKHPYMYAAYKEKKYAFASDYARLDIVYENGGVYLDNDVELLRNIDDLLYDEAFVGISVSGFVGTGLGFGAVRGQSVIKEMRDFYKGYSFTDGSGTLNLQTNGHYQTALLTQNGLSPLNRLQLLHGLRIYPTDVLSPIDYLGNPLAFTKNTFAIHHYDASWFDITDAVNRNKELCARRAFYNKYFGDKS